VRECSSTAYGTFGDVLGDPVGGVGLLSVRCTVGVVISTFRAGTTWPSTRARLPWSQVNPSHYTRRRHISNSRFYIPRTCHCIYG
jgi:hypothetical protein